MYFELLVELVTCINIIIKLKLLFFQYTKYIKAHNDIDRVICMFLSNTCIMQTGITLYTFIEAFIFNSIPEL